MSLIILGDPVNTNPDRDTLRQRIAEALRPGSRDRSGQYPEGLMRDVEAVMAVLPDPTDRAAVLEEAADAVFALDYDVMVGEEGDENLGSMREAWDLGTIHAEKLLRRLAAEAPTTTKPETDGEPYAGDERPCLACTHSMDSHIRVDGEIRCAFEDCSDPTPAGVGQDGAQPCTECGHPKDTHHEGDDPVTPGTCDACETDDPDEARHDYRAATS